MIELFKSWLAHPDIRNLDIDDPRMTVMRRKILKEKQFLRHIYLEWYTTILDVIPLKVKPVLEIGSGAGFMNEIYPDLIASEIFYCPEISVVLDGQRLPFSSSSIGSIVMTDVLHHIPHVRSFFLEAVRCLEPSGKVVMIEPYVSTWSRIIYTYFHHEPFNPQAENWEFPSIGPLSSANGALPWIIFERDIKQFEKEFPELRLKSIQPMMPFCYILSGGVSLRTLMPDWTYSFWRLFENYFPKKMFGMFALIELERI